VNNSPEQTILTRIIFQILAVYYQFLNNFSSSAYFYNKALQQCITAGDTELLVIPPPGSEEKIFDERKPHRDMDILLNQPIKLFIIFLLSEATKHFSLTDTKQYLSNIALQTLKETGPSVTRFVQFSAQCCCSINVFQPSCSRPRKTV